MGKEAIIPPSGIYRSQECYHSHIFWFKIFTPTIQTHIGEGHSRRDGTSALNSENKDKPHPSTNLRDLTEDTTNTGLWNGRELGAVGVPL